jgi:L-rhamnose 1-dehydrogenase
MSTSTTASPGIAGSNLLPGKVVAITGASRGIGRACALACAAHGATGVVVHYFGDTQTTAEAESLQQELAELGAKAVLVAGDISDAAVGQAVADAAEREFGRLDVFVSNAGICPFMGFLEMEASTWRKVQDVNLNGAFFATQAAARLMSRQTPRGGSIIAIASISALVGGEFQSHYTPTKAGLKSMMESAAIGLGPLGIRCNSVLPGTIETAINADDLKDDAKRQRMVDRHPLRRLGQPDDIAGPVVFLASDLAKFMTGSSVLVDGGCFVNLQ